jgi:PAS domain S-box-containing protein
MTREPDSTAPPHAFAALFDAAAVGLAVLDARSRPLHVNRSLCELLATPADELLARESFYLGSAAQVAEEAKQRLAMQTGGLERYSCELALERSGGTTAWLRQTCSVARGQDGRPRHIVVELQDVSEAKACERTLHQAEELFRHTFDEAALGIVHLDASGRIVRVNRKLCEMHGYAREELLGMSALDLMADAGESARDDVAGLLRGHWRHYTAERRFVRKDGEAYPARVSVSLIRPGGAQPFLVSMVEDLSKQKAEERRMRQMAHMLDQATDAIIVHDDQRRVRFWNHSAERLFGWRAQQALGRTFADLAGEGAALTDQELASLHERGHLVVQVVCRTCDGRLLDVERRFTVVEDEHAPAVVLSVNTDVTERVKAQRELESANRELQAQVRRAR